MFSTLFSFIILEKSTMEMCDDVCGTSYAKINRVYKQKLIEQLIKTDVYNDIRNIL